MTYLWLKAAHLVSVIAWMAGMLYLPRLFVYHCKAVPGGELSDTLKVMERRLLKAIMTPAMVATWVFGMWLAGEGQWWKAPWLHGKLLLVVAMTVMHGYLARAQRRFAADERPGGEGYWRLMNEVPTVLMIAIVLFVVIKPLS